MLAALQQLRDVDLTLQREAQNVDYGPDMAKLVASFQSGSQAEAASKQYNTACQQLQGIADTEATALDVCEVNVIHGRDFCSPVSGQRVRLVFNSDAPEPPEAMTPASDFFTVDAGTIEAGTACLNLYTGYEEDDQLGLFTFDGGRWVPLSRAFQFREAGRAVEVQFDQLPPNLAAFKPLKDVP
jgi:hypothetical protein